MNAKLRKRLDLLEKTTHVNRTTAMEAITAAALSVISDEDLEKLHQVAERDAPLSECIPKEKAALERYEAALRIASRS